MRRKREVMVILKSGERLYVRCADFTAETRGGELSGYSITGQDPKNKVLFLDMAEVAVVKRVR